MTTLKYKDDTDRAYGLSGMGVCMYVMENERYIEALSLDAEADMGMTVSMDFYYAPNQAVSAKSVWQRRLHEFNASVSLLVSNLLARSMVREHDLPTPQLLSLMKKELEKEGADRCQLEPDEVGVVFNKAVNYMHRVFSYAEVADMVSSLASDLLKERTLGPGQIAYRLERLSHM